MLIAIIEVIICLLPAGHHVAPCHLYFGSRGQQRDFYYRQQWEQYVQAGVLAGDKGLVTAFSQDAPSKTYVTHRIRENGRQLCKLLMQVRCMTEDVVQCKLVGMLLMTCTACCVPAAWQWA